MFYGFAEKLVTIPGYEIDHVLDDIQSLNVRAMTGELPVTAISAHAYPYVADKYWIMKTGASMGEGYGPIIVSKKYKTIVGARSRSKCRHRSARKTNHREFILAFMVRAHQIG